MIHKAFSAILKCMLKRIIFFLMYACFEILINEDSGNYLKYYEL